MGDINAITVFPIAENEIEREYSDITAIKVGVIQIAGTVCDQGYFLQKVIPLPVPDYVLSV